jgi:hypothetical protein
MFVRVRVGQLIDRFQNAWTEKALLLIAPNGRWLCTVFRRPPPPHRNLDLPIAFSGNYRRRSKASTAFLRGSVGKHAAGDCKVMDGPEGLYANARQHCLPMALAGLWEVLRWRDGTALRIFPIVTTDANKMTAELRDKMPVILEAADWPAWLG